MRKWPRFRCASDRSCWQGFRCASDPPPYSGSSGSIVVVVVVEVTFRGRCSIWWSSCVTFCGRSSIWWCSCVTFRGRRSIRWSSIYIYTFHLTWWKNFNELPDSPFRLPAALLAEVPFCTLPDRVRFGGIVTYYWTAGCKKCKVRKTDDRWSRSLDGYWCTRTLWLLYQIHVRKCPKANGLVGDCWLEEAVLFPQVGHTAQPSEASSCLRNGDSFVTHFLNAYRIIQRVGLGMVGGLTKKDKHQASWRQDHHGGHFGICTDMSFRVRGYNSCQWAQWNGTL